LVFSPQFLCFYKGSSFSLSNSFPSVLLALGRFTRAVPELFFPDAGATIRIKSHLEEVSMSDDSGNSFLWFLAGLGLGAVAGVLYAPRSGDETREALRSKAEESRERLRHHAREAKSQASDWVDRGRDVLSQQKDQFRAAYDAGRQAYHEATAAEGGAKNL
jgi:gas vesicle protein